MIATLTREAGRFAIGTAGPARIAPSVIKRLVLKMRITKWLWLVRTASCDRNGTHGDSS